MYPSFSVGSSMGAGYPTGSAPKLTKQQMLAQLKAQAEQRKQAHGAEATSGTLQAIESTTEPVVAKITTPSRPLKAAGMASGFISGLMGSKAQQGQAHAKTETVFMKPFATVADPLVLAEADVVPSENVFALETQVPQSGPERNRYEEFKKICTEQDIPAGIMQLLWHHLENDLTVIDVDTSISMASVDRPQSQESQDNVEILNFGENAKGMYQMPPRSRMEEAKERLREITPIACTANRRGVIHLKTLSDPQGKRLDMRQLTSGRAMQEMSSFINGLRPDLDHTPSVTSYYDSCQEAFDMRRSGRVQSATIINFSDGVPNQKPDPRVEAIYQGYVNQVLHNRGDYRRPDGTIVPYSVASRWNMDADTPEMMRRLSVLAGHYNVPTTIAACTEDKYAMGEQNELDDLHTNVAVLDDVKAEQREVIRHQGLRFPFNKAMYLALNFIAPKEPAFDNLDEKPLTPAELEKVLGYYPGYEAYMQNLETSMTAVEAASERPQPSAPPLIGHFSGMRI